MQDLPFAKMLLFFPVGYVKFIAWGQTPQDNRKKCRQNFGHSVELQHFAAEGLPSSAVYGALEGIVIMR